MHWCRLLVSALSSICESFCQIDPGIAVVEPFLQTQIPVTLIQGKIDNKTFESMRFYETIATKGANYDF